MEKNTILIVDDYEFNRLMLCDMFTDLDIIEAENGIVAIEEFEKHKDEICCVLTDIMMPVLDGFGLLDYFSKNKYTDKVPIFVISADPSSNVLQRAYTLGAEDVINKPFNISFTKRRILECIELHRLREKLIELTGEASFDDV